MAKKRNGRQDAIRDIVRNKDVRTQRVLVDELLSLIHISEPTRH